MRAVSDELAAVLDGGQYELDLRLDVFYGAERTLAGLTVYPSWELKWVKSADVPGSGSVLVQVQMPDGSSLTPREFTSRLAPFGQEVAPLLTVRAGAFAETVMAGRYRIVDVPSARDENMVHAARVITVGSYVELRLADQLEAVREWGFAAPEQPVHTSDAWQEMARLTGMRIVRSAPTVSVPASIVYDMSDGGRLKAVQALADALGGTLYVTADGALTVLADGEGESVRTFPYRGSTVLDFEIGMSSEGVYNEVVGNFEAEDRSPIVAPPARVTDGPLRVDGPFGRRTRYYASPFVKTREQADSALAKILARSSTAKAYRTSFPAILDPRVEVGDTVTVEQDTHTYAAVVVEVAWKADSTMTLTVDIVRTLDQANLLGV